MLCSQKSISLPRHFLFSKICHITWTSSALKVNHTSKTYFLNHIYFYYRRRLSLTLSATLGTVRNEAMKSTDLQSHECVQAESSYHKSSHLDVSGACVRADAGFFGLSAPCIRAGKGMGLVGYNAWSTTTCHLLTDQYMLPFHQRLFTVVIFAWSSKMLIRHSERETHTKYTIAPACSSIQRGSWGEGGGQDRERERVTEERLCFARMSNFFQLNGEKGWRGMTMLSDLCSLNHPTVCLCGWESSYHHNQDRTEMMVSY